MKQETKTGLVLVGLVAIIAVIYLRFGDSEPSPVVVTVNRLNALQLEVQEWEKKNNKLPETLADLGLPDEAVTDHKGAPFVYENDNGWVTISSLGADGKPGGVMFNADQTVEFESQIRK